MKERRVVLLIRLPLLRMLGSLSEKTALSDKYTYPRRAQHSFLEYLNRMASNSATFRRYENDFQQYRSIKQPADIRERLS